MQEQFIRNLKAMLAEKKDKALLISATGTGKTYASAFAMREMGFRRVLFVVHRNRICKQARKSFEMVFGNGIRTGLVSGEGGTDADYAADFVFATVQTLSKIENLERFPKDYFDATIYDEAHHTSAGSYRRIMEYFTPKFCLGMTATPDKREDHLEGKNIYEIFGHNIAYEIRLQQAMEEDLLCTFHYFGITDLQWIADEGKTKEERAEHFRFLTSKERVDHVLAQASYYGYSGSRVKGLIFCSRVEEAKELSKLFNARGLKTVALSGADREEVREASIEKLAKDIDTRYPEKNAFGVTTYLDANGNAQEYLDYIFSCDVLTEGTDIVEVNQVIMLRPTESPIVFIQQLGRGLRKAEEKEFVVVLDFIGNYQNNFMIPIALSGDRSYSKDTIRRVTREGARVIPGGSTIHFDAVAKQHIYDAIDRMSTPKKMLMEKYQNVKDRLGHIPNILEFYAQGEIDPMLLIQYTKASYHIFLERYDPDYQIKFTEKQEAVLNFVSQILCGGQRPHELLMIRGWLRGETVDPTYMEQALAKYQRPFHRKDYASAQHVLCMDWLNAPADKKQYLEIDVFREIEQAKAHYKSVSAYAWMMEDKLFRAELERVVEYGLRRYVDQYRVVDAYGLALYQKYSRKDVCRILNWEKDESSTMYGYRYKHGTCPIFVTYNKKEEEISASTNYDDRFVNEQTFSWMTRSRVSLEKPEIQKIIHSQENGEHIFLFVKKSDDEGSDFYYMGEVTPGEYRQTTIRDDHGVDLPIMNFQLKLTHPVREDIYEYFVGEEAI